MMRVSPDHGVNPSLDLCFLCLEPKGIALLGHLTKEKRDALFGEEVSKEAAYNDTARSAAAPRKAVYDKEPCDACKGHMKKGIICISARSDSEDPSNPYRTGGWVVLAEDAARRIFGKSPALENILKKRATFVADEIWTLAGFPPIPTANTSAHHIG